MPNYVYMCDNCSHLETVRRPADDRDKPLNEECPKCGGSEWTRGIERKVNFIGEKGKGKWGKK